MKRRVASSRRLPRKRETLRVKSHASMNRLMRKNKARMICRSSSQQRTLRSVFSVVCPTAPSCSGFSSRDLFALRLRCIASAGPFCGLLAFVASYTGLITRRSILPHAQHLIPMWCLISVLQYIHCYLSRHASTQLSKLPEKASLSSEVFPEVSCAS